MCAAPPVRGAAAYGADSGNGGGSGNGRAPQRFPPAAEPGAGRDPVGASGARFAGARIGCRPPAVHGAARDVSGVRHHGLMVRRTGKKTRVAAARQPEVRLPPLRPHEGGGLEPDGDYDGVELAGLDLSGGDGAGALFLDCALRDCVLEQTSLVRARFVDSVLTGVRGVGADLAGASLRDSEIVDARLGGVQLHGAALERVLVRGGKIDYLNLRDARLTDVVFEGCVLSEPDFGAARLERVEFRECVLRRADFAGARMRDVDLRRVTELDVARGVEGLSGAVISTAQLMDLAPVFAAQLGVRVED
ncbi:hypothetical protein SSP531S_55710 [Streptomyces spongiicola]|uniref:Pentapeptide repeat-containing protein n=2 Tax=Streptomyces spongiicola TaxID=1690221 RepID=A0A388T752_9ACTN|nr:hypothetical protein SSP531S_55710 [Streptomyces spongiicola]